MGSRMTLAKGLFLGCRYTPFVLCVLHARSTLAIVLISQLTKQIILFAVEFSLRIEVCMRLRYVGKVDLQSCEDCPGLAESNIRQCAEIHDLLAR
jgi:hypothetical protein